MSFLRKCIQYKLGVLSEQKIHFTQWIVKRNPNNRIPNYSQWLLLTITWFDIYLDLCACESRSTSLPTFSTDWVKHNSRENHTLKVCYDWNALTFSYLRAYLASFSSSHAVLPPPKFLLAVFSKPWRTMTSKEHSMNDHRGQTWTQLLQQTDSQYLNETLGQLPAGLTWGRLDDHHGELREKQQSWQWRPGPPHDTIVKIQKYKQCSVKDTDIKIRCRDLSVWNSSHLWEIQSKQEWKHFKFVCFNIPTTIYQLQ